ncbi:MAG: T9SS type A sorting domain-containing protein [Candidatus Sabulitectum sp.]|nr:T9SS type A sorting domain-containing protein [Candidatus Sabulitectum sp.]
MLKLILLVLVSAFAFGAVVNSPTEAANLVMETMLTDLSNKEVRSLDGFLLRGDFMGAWSHPEIIVPFNGYLVLVDDYALANWEHPCRWVFVSPDGEMNTIRMTVPPDALPRMNVEYTSLPETDNGKGQYEDFIAWWVPNVQSTSTSADHMYAWIISGGANQSNNHTRYYGDVQFIYNVLAHDYLLPDDHIIVCFADGLNPAPDLSNGLNSNPDFDDDGDSDIIYDATTAGVTSGYNAINALVGADDHLFIYTTDHGGSGKYAFDSPPEVTLNLWGSTLDDDTFMGYMDAFSAMSIHVVMEQCYSGGFLGEVINTGATQPRTFASAANASESSYAGATYPEYDEYVYYWTGAVHGSTPPTTSVPGGALPGTPDMNGDGKISMYEAAFKAEEWDTCAQSGQEHPMWDDTPDSCGDDYYLGGLIVTSVENLSASVPSMDLSISQNPVVSTAMVNFTLPSPAHATIEILDIAGRIVSIPVSGSVASGSHTVASGLENAPAGIYVVRLTTGSHIETLRAVRL